MARSVLQKRLRDEAARQDIPIHQDWELRDMQQSADGVKATSTDGREISASFAIGCDGLHAVTRKLVLQKHSMSELAADSTGLVMVRTFSSLKHIMPLTIARSAASVQKPEA